MSVLQRRLVMKRFLLVTLIATMSGLSAQEDSSAEETGSAPETESNQEVGYAAASSAEAPQRRDWQNWVFAGSALLTVAAGVVIISLNSGTNNH